MLNLKQRKKKFYESLSIYDETKIFGDPYIESIKNFRNKKYSKINNNIHDCDIIYSNSYDTGDYSLCFKLKISHDSRWKKLFDIIVLILIFGSTCKILFRLCIQNDPCNINYVHENIPLFIIIDIFIDIIFFIEITLNFFQEYKDYSSGIIIKSHKKIAYNYIFKGTFIFDIISVIPYEFIYTNYMFLKLLRVVRLPKLIGIANYIKIDSLIERWFDSSDNNHLQIIFNIRYFYKIFRIISVAVIIGYIFGCIWFYLCSIYTLDCNNYINIDIKERGDFISTYRLLDRHDWEKLVISCYYIFTTLATVGFGDFHPQNDTERILAMFIMIIGVTLFSYVMSNFNELILSYDKILGVIDKGSELRHWLNLISKYSTEKLSVEIIGKIDKNFNYFWKKDRNEVLCKHKDFLKNLPNELKIKLIEYLWGDVFFKFSEFFLYKLNYPQIYFKFYYHIAFNLLPRRYFHNEYIYQVNDDIEEMNLIINGKVSIHITDKENKTYVKNIDAKDYIGDFYCLYNIKTQFLYKSENETESYAITKIDLLEGLHKYKDLSNAFRIRSYNRYKEQFYDFMISKNQIVLFENLNDENFVDMNANVNGFNIDSVLKENIEKINYEINEIKNDIEIMNSRLDETYTSLKNEYNIFSNNTESQIDELILNLKNIQEKIIN